LVFILAFNLVSTGRGSMVDPSTPSTSNNIDFVGHAGGAITGLFWGLAFLPRTNTSYGRKLKYWGMSLTLSFFILFILLLFLTKQDF